MRDQIAEYVVSLYRDIPMAVYEGLLSALCLGVVVIIACYGWKRGWRKIVGLLLAEYVFLIYCTTVIFRTTADGNGHEYKPFWSYEAIKNGGEDLIAENIMNVAVFVPVGMMLGIVTQKTRKAQNNFRTRTARIAPIIGVGLIISVSIETMQYFFHRGFAETDDVMHNTLGCLIGYGLIGLIRKIIKITT